MRPACAGPVRLPTPGIGRLTGSGCRGNQRQVDYISLSMAAADGSCCGSRATPTRRHGGATSLRLGIGEGFHACNNLWSVHPSNPAPTPPSSDGPGPVLPFDSLRSIASGLAWALRAVPDDNGDRATARSVRLIATSLSDIWLITWPDGSTLGPHDHGGARSVLHMLEGELIETYADRSEAWPSRVRALRSSDARCGGTSLVHDLANRSGARATSLHLYSPPISDLTLFQRSTGGDEPAHAGR